MANTTKNQGEIFHNDNMKKERIQKIEKQVIQVKWKILEAVILLTFFFNVENYTNTSKKEIEKMEQLNKKLIYEVFNLSRTAPHRNPKKKMVAGNAWKLLIIKRQCLITIYGTRIKKD